MNVWEHLLSNFAIVAITTFLWTLTYRQLSLLRERHQALALGLIMSAGALAVMAFPFNFREGVYLDTRYTFLALSGFFGGPWAAVLPFLTALLRRIATGGTGVSVAVPHMVVATGLGLSGFFIRKQKIPSFTSLIGMSGAVAFSGTFGFYLVLPSSIWWQLTLETVLPFAGILFGATFLAACALTQELHRHVATVENRVYRAIIEALPDCLNAKDIEGRFIVANPATAKLMGAKSAVDLHGKTDADFYSADTASEFRRTEVEMMQRAEPTRLRQNFIKADGHETWLSTLKAPLRDKHGKLIGLITHNKDITEQHQLEITLAETKAKLEDALASMADGLAMFDADGRLLFQNDKHTELFPLTSDLRQPGVNLREIVSASLERGEVAASDHRPEILADQITKDLLTAGNRIFPLANGRWVETRTRSSRDGGMTIVFSDITEVRRKERELSQLNAKLAALADTDGLTGVINRRGFDRVLDSAVQDAIRDEADLGLLMIDVDRFKAFNDTYGHPAGDQCLKRVAQTLEGLLSKSPGVSVARYGGEEFAVILPGMGATATLEVAHWICRAVRDLSLNHVGSEKGVVTVSVGAATWQNSKGRDIGQLLRYADEALYHAKTSGRGCVRGLNVIKAA
ncbi:diguanylate cyclase [Rhizobium rhizoryzae]|uniref:diguanylate cyclase n=1 Tax=Rhizobium rhizoryzae TaxID=451876 RepID=UPI0028B1B5CD|nr:diguanylate cyclase [Rhizobium rhizoryzae]